MSTIQEGNHFEYRKFIFELAVEAWNIQPYNADVNLLVAWSYLDVLAIAHNRRINTEMPSLPCNFFSNLANLHAFALKRIPTEILIQAIIMEQRVVDRFSEDRPEPFVMFTEGEGVAKMWTVYTGENK
jgi:hypothetical protein